MKNRIINAALREIVAFSNTAFVPNSMSLDWDDTLNYGDRINPFIMSKLTGLRIIHDQSRFRKRFTCIGSILDRSFVDDTIVWGTGFISNNSYPKTLKLDIRAVRGPLTRDILISHSVKCPPIYGDPSILVGDYIPIKNNKKTCILGVIPHYSEDFDSLAHNTKNSNYANDITIININKHPITVVEEIAKCQYIASSSLHGCIMADVYRIPCFHVVFSNNVIGGNFKFDDYRLGLNSKALYQLDMTHKPFDAEALMKCVDNSTLVQLEDMNYAKQRLISSFPFKLI